MKPEEIKVGGLYQACCHSVVQYKVISINGLKLRYRCNIHSLEVEQLLPDFAKSVSYQIGSVQPLDATQPADLTKCQLDRLSRLPTSVRPLFDAAYRATEPTAGLILAMCLDCVGPKNPVTEVRKCANDICPLWRAAQAAWVSFERLMDEIVDEIEPDPMDPGV